MVCALGLDGRRELWLWSSLRPFPYGKEVFLTSHPSRWLIISCFLIGISPPSIASKPTLTPLQVVYQWRQSYPKGLPKAATLTIANLRKGLSQKQVIEQNNLLLKDLQFKYLDVKVLDEERKGGRGRYRSRCECGRKARPCYRNSLTVTFRQYI